MERIRELKKELGENYLFRRFLSDKEIRKLQKSNPTFFESQIVASLTAGCVKMECCVCKASNNLQLGYDVFVRDDPVSSDWIFYDCIDSPNVSVGTKETDMLALLDQVVEWNGLSYTECCFEKLDGKNVLKKYGKKELRNNESHGSGSSHDADVATREALCCDFLGKGRDVADRERTSGIRAVSGKCCGCTGSGSSEDFRWVENQAGEREVGC